MTDGHIGRLELTWTNKDLALLADEAGNYEWVPRTDYRVAEVRLLHHAGHVGDPDVPPHNLLVRGDALNALTSLAKLPGVAEDHAGQVKLIYIDPPFNTKQSFLTYDDSLDHSVWLTMMRDRLEQIRPLLAPDGSVWVHCDDSEQHRLRCVMDEVFGVDRFVATIVWQKRYSRDNRPAIGPVHDFIHVYAPSGGDWKKFRNRLPPGDKALKQYRNPNNDPRGPWRPLPMDAQGYRANQMYEIVGPDGTVHLPPKGRCWSMTRDRYDELEAAGRIYFGQDGTGRPSVIRYLDEHPGLVPWTWWPHEDAGHNDEAKKEILELFPDQQAFDTPKPERLMQRIITIATDPGDIVLDCFAGSGTTAAVAHKMGRRWIAVERSLETVTRYLVPRLTRVVAGADGGGVSAAEGWNGGGGFRVVDVAPSMFDVEDGTVVLADWATSTSLAEATAAQLGYAYDSDAAPFCGRKGRSMLAVIDGLVSVDVVELLMGLLNDDEQLVLAGTAIDPQADDTLRSRRRGSRARKIPQSLLREYTSGNRRDLVQRAAKLDALVADHADGNNRQSHAVMP